MLRPLRVLQRIGFHRSSVIHVKTFSTLSWCLNLKKIISLYNCS